MKKTYLLVLFFCVISCLVMRAQTATELQEKEELVIVEDAAKSKIRESQKAYNEGV